MILKLIKANQKDYLSKLDLILQKRKLQNPKIDQKVKYIIQDIKKNKVRKILKN